MDRSNRNIKKAFRSAGTQFPYALKHTALHVTQTAQKAAGPPVSVPKVIMISRLFGPRWISVHGVFSRGLSSAVQPAPVWKSEPDYTKVAFMESTSAKHKN